MDDTGFELVDVTHSGNKQLRNPAKPGGAESGAVEAEIALDDPRLLRIVSAWSRLPEAIRSAMVAVLDAAE